MGERVAFRLKFQLVSCIHEGNCKFKGHKLQASTINIFVRLNSQFRLPQNFISQNDRGNLALSIEYHLYSGIHVPGSEFCRWNLPKLSFLITPFRRVNLKIILKFSFESFPILITVLCKGRVIELCNIKIVLIFVLVFLHESQIRSTFFSGSRAFPRVKIKKSVYLKNINPNEVKVVFS